jgi:hypothetical protein
MVEWGIRSAALVNRDGIVCAIIFSGTSRADELPGSRVIATQTLAQKLH